MRFWFDLIIDAGSWAGATICIFEGARRVILLQRKRVALALLCMGLIYCGSVGGFSIHRFWLMGEVLEGPHAGWGSELPTEWRSDLSPSEREQNSKAYASAVYATTGNLVRYFLASGERVEFTPTQEEIRDREQRLLARGELEGHRKEALLRGIAMLAVAIITAIIGLLYGYHLKISPANPALQGTRDEAARP